MKEVVFFLVAAVVVFLKIKGALTDKPGESVSSPEVFPPVEPLEPSVEVPVTAVLHSLERKKKQVHGAQPPVHKTVADEAQPEPPTDKKRSFGIKDKSDAKRAIIYAEIFNRKYN